MGPVSLLKRWLRHRRIALDTNLFIYHLGKHSECPLVASLFQELQQRRSAIALTSTVTLAEVLVPYYRLGDAKKIQQAVDFVRGQGTIDVIAVDETIASRAGQLRAEFRRLKTPDAIQLATAILHGASLFLTADRDFPRGPIAGTAIEVLKAR